MEFDTKSAVRKEEPNAEKFSSRLGFCEVCAIEDAKYTCPKCEVKTCSLKCCKIHKLEIECDGQRDRTKFVPLRKFTNMDLASDYRLLEEIARNVDASRKQFNKFERRANLSVPLMKLRSAAKLRRTTLKFFPYIFEKRRINTTYLNFKTNIIFWHIDWIFDNADKLKLTDIRVPETSTVSSVLSKHFSKESDENLQFYKAVDIPGVKIYLKAEQKKGEKFYELDPSLTLRECLKNKVIIEYPSIHVVLKDHSYGGDIMESDDDDESNAEVSTNFLFASDNSDVELSPEER